MPDYSWPPSDKRRVLGKRVTRLDGVLKASGKAKYNSDLRPEGMLHAVMLTSPHAHAKIRTLDVSAAKASKGVTAVRLIAKEGTELQWQGQEIAIVAASTEEQAKDALRKIKVEYDVLPHFVKEQDLGKAGSNGKPAGEVVVGDPEQAFKDAAVTHEGSYGIPVITHCCLEPHGQTIQWTEGELKYWPSTQNVSAVGVELAKLLETPADTVKVHMDYMGGGFGAKFPPDLWGAECARLSKESGGKPVKFFLDRRQELLIAGNRPSFYANIRVGGSKDGKITAWQSESWATGGFGGASVAPGLMPYLFTGVANKRFNHTSVSTNTGSARAWRAPNHPQVSFLTCAAVDDFAAKLGMDPLQVFLKNVDATARPEVYRTQLEKAADMIGWKGKWKGRGADKGTIKTGLGIGVATWQGAGHNSKCRATILPDGTAEVTLGSQDLGSGTRTVIAMVAAETYGLPISAIRVNIGDSSYPTSGASGGSTTVGGVSSSTRKATVNALYKLFEAAAPSIGSTVDELEAVDGRIQVKGNPNKGITWQQACSKLGVNKISEDGENNSRNPGNLNSPGASGVQMAEVSVDTETGVVRMNKLVAVQDCGVVINLKTAESQVYGACIMSICAALMEEQIRDAASGRTLNPDMEFYKLAGIKDIGEIEVYMDQRPEFEKKGVIGLGEPPAIPGVAAIANAVANAIGVRVPQVPLTPNRVLAALAERRMA